MFNDCTAPRPLQSGHTAVGQRDQFLGVSVSGHVCLCAFHCHCVLIRHNSSQTSLHFSGKEKVHHFTFWQAPFMPEIPCLWFSESIGAISSLNLAENKGWCIFRLNGWLPSVICFSWRGKKVGNLEKYYLGCHFHSFICLFGFAVRVCWILFSRRFAIAIGFEVMTVFCHSNSYVAGPGEVVADLQSTRLSLTVLGVWDRAMRKQPGLEGLNQNLDLLRQEAFEFLRPAFSIYMWGCWG